MGLATPVEFRQNTSMLSESNRRDPNVYNKRRNFTSMPQDSYPARVVAEVSLSKFLFNFDLLARQDPVIAMLKCNGYGHGAQPLAEALQSQRAKRTYGIGVATIQEAIELRSSGIRLAIFVFSDCTPFTDEVAALCQKYNLTAILHSKEDVIQLCRHRNLKFHLKFNTGMNRLGIDPSDVSEVTRLLWRAKLRPMGVCTHLADAGHLDAKITRRQWERFKEVLSVFSDVSCVHAESSAALFPKRKLSWESVCNVIRPGIGLYGYGSSKLKPILSLSARVLKNSTLAVGENVGYGATFVARKVTRQSILACGYGDGLHRTLSNKTLMINGRKQCLLGRVSMDAISVEGVFKPGKWVQLLGRTAEQGQHMASEAGTVVYEVLTSLSQRVQRVYSE